MNVNLRWVVLLAGVLLLLGSAFGAFQTIRFTASAAETDGSVTRLNAGGSHPQIAFRTQDGAVVDYAQGGMIMGLKVGQAVRVLYDPANPAESARVRSFGSLWGSSLALAAVGALLLAAAISPIGFYFRGR